MRRIPRLERSIDLSRLRISPHKYSPYVCSTCRHQITSFSTSALRAAQDKLPLSEKVRRNIWGTDNPPGLKDPYRGESKFNQARTGVQKLEPETEVLEEEHELEIEEDEKPTLAAAPEDSTYEPATTWDGLEEVGEYDGYEAWDAVHGFRSVFSPNEIMTDSFQITATLRRALVEVFALKQADKPLSQLFDQEPSEDLTQRVRITPNGTGAKLKFSKQTSKEELVQSLSGALDGPAEKFVPTESEEDVAADRSDIDPLGSSTTLVDEVAEKENPTESEEDIVADRSDIDPLHETTHSTYKDLVKSWNFSWRRVPLADPEIKFAVMKRMLQLSGIKYPDAAIKRTKTAGDFLEYVIKPPKPRKVIDALAKKSELLDLPNVSVFAKRVTPIDKEKAVGRWKIIEQELERRGLPIIGHE